MGGRVLVVQPGYLGFFGCTAAVRSSADAGHGGHDGRQTVHDTDLGVVCLWPVAVDEFEVKSK